MKITQMMVDTPKVVALIPSPDQGDVVANPSPAPRISKISDKPAAAAAPAKIAPQDTALAETAARFAASLRSTPTAVSSSVVCLPVSFMQNCHVGDERSR